MTTKKFKLLELKSIGERASYLLSLKMKGGLSYTIGQWSEPFIKKMEAINAQHRAIILSFCNEGENTVPPEKTSACQKAIDDFYETIDSVTFDKFDLSWIEHMEVENIGVLHQFMGDEKKEIASEQPAGEPAK